MTTLADQTMTYDQAGRHLSTHTTGGGGATVAYARDASGGIASMTTTIGSGSPSSVNYSGGPGVQFTMNSGNTAVNEVMLSLPGGVTESIQGGSAQVWSYPDLHGDDTVTANGSGTRTGSIAIYDPFGDLIDLTTGLIGTAAANVEGPINTTTAGANYGWEGSHGKQSQTSGDIATIEMGERQYVPILGRFLSTDPVPGGNSNAYNYPNDPINTNDLTGDCMMLDGIACTAAAAAVVDRSERSNRAQEDAWVRNNAPFCFPYAHGTMCEVTGNLHPEGKPAGGHGHVPTSLSINGEACAGACGDVTLNLGQKTELSLDLGWGPKAGIAGSIGGDVGEESGWNLSEKCTVVPGIGGYEEGAWDSKNQWSGGVGGSVGAEIGCAGLAGYTFSW